MMSNIKKAFNSKISKVMSCMTKDTRMMKQTLELNTPLNKLMHCESSPRFLHIDSSHKVRVIGDVVEDV